MNGVADMGLAPQNAVAPGSDALAALDIERVRSDFPVLHQTVNGKPLVYLDSAASAQKPRRVIDAISAFYEHDFSNIHRGAHTLSTRATEAYEHARKTVQLFINAAATEEIVFVRGCTEAINLVASCFGRSQVSEGDEIIVTEMEHHSNLVPWQLLCEQRGAKLRVVPIDDAGDLCLDVYQQLLSSRTRLVAVAHVSNVLGTVNPVRELVERAHAVGAKVLVDGAQSVVHFPVDVQQLGCDFYAFSGHKLYGPTGIGILYGRRELLEQLPPYQGGGGMVDVVDLAHSTFLDAPLRFEAGTPHVAGAVGLAAAIDYLNDLGMHNLAAHEQALLAYAQRELTQIEGLRLIGQARRKTSVLSLTLPGAHASDIGTLLDHQGVAIRAGHHCAQTVMRRYNVPATARASLGLYNNKADIDALVVGLRKVLELFA